MPVLSRRAVLSSAAALPFAASWAAPVPGSYGTVRSHGAGLDNIVAADAVIEQVAWGLQWAEGPVWIKDGGYLLFSDPKANIMYRWSASGSMSEFLKPSGFAGAADPSLREPGSNGLAVDGKGTLFLADSGSRAIAKYDLAAKKKNLLTERFEGKRFNSPNDLVIAKSGAIYFTDPAFGLEGLEQSPAKELGFAGVYRLAPNGSLTLLDKSLSRPNGIALTPDEDTLYVTNSDAAQPVLKAYGLRPDGLVQSESFAFNFKTMMAAGLKGSPDGLKIDEDGNIFVSGPGGIIVLSKEEKLLGLISVTGRATSNCAFGEDGSTLFITASDIVAKVRLKTKAANWS